MNRVLFSIIILIIQYNIILAQPSTTELYVKFNNNYSISWNVSENKVIKKQLPLDFQNINIISIENSFRFDKDPKLLRTLRFKFESENDKDLFLQKNKNSNNIDYIEPVQYATADYVPNDVSYSNQWHLEKIQASQAWNLNQGNSNIVIAIVDDAIETTHDDLAPNIVHQRDVADNDNNANPPTTAFNHGTHVAGIASAATSNILGVASIGFSCSLMAIKAGDGTLDSDGRIAITHGNEGISYAAANGADIINCSFGGGFSNTEQNVINSAINQGAIVVAAAGNNNSSIPNYPAALSGVISVGATDNNDKKASFSNYGSWVDISAPGDNILSTTIGCTYDNFGGTSMASPLVAGLLGLIKSENPSDTNNELIARLLDGAENIDTENPNYIGKLGAGRINALNSVCRAQESNLYFTGTNLSGSPTLNLALNNIFIQESYLNSGAPVIEVYRAGNKIEITGTNSNPTTIDDDFFAEVSDDGMCSVNSPYSLYSYETIGLACAHAIELVSNGSYEAFGPSEGSGGSQFGIPQLHANWYQFTPSTNGNVTITSCGSGSDTRVLLHSGDCDNLNLLDSSDNGCNTFNTILNCSNININSNLASNILNFPVTANTTYYIEWDNPLSEAAFEFQFILN